MRSQESGIPLYVRMREKLRSELAQMEPGDPIPAEAELEKKFGVSRITVRRAVEELVAEGLLLRQQGRGTFVQKPRLTYDLNLITSWTEHMKLLGLSPKTRHRKITRERPLAHIADALRLGEEDEVIRIQRVRLARQEPISYMVNYIPVSLVPDFMRRKPSDESLYEYLATEYGLIPAVAFDTVSAHPASDEEAAALHIERKSPALSIRRVSYLEDGTPMELAIVVSRSDRYQYRVTVHGKSSVQSRPLLDRVLEDLAVRK